MRRFLIFTSFRTLQDNVLRLRTPVTGRDGSVMNEIVVPRGTVVYPAGLHSGISREIWGDDALEFIPERWLSPLPAEVAAASIPGVYSNLYGRPSISLARADRSRCFRMAFGGGERACIGFRFAILEMSKLVSCISLFIIATLNPFRGHPCSAYRGFPVLPLHA